MNIHKTRRTLESKNNYTKPACSIEYYVTYRTISPKVTRIYALLRELVQKRMHKSKVGQILTPFPVYSINHSWHLSVRFYLIRAINVYTFDTSTPKTTLQPTRRITKIYTKKKLFLQKTKFVVEYVLFVWKLKIRTYTHLL